MKKNFTFDNNRNCKKELMSRRHQKFDRVRKLAEIGEKGQKMETETSKDIEESIETLDYCKFYPENIRTLLNHSLKGQIPDPLPPLDLFTISYYRRAGKSVYQCRQFNSKQLDPHLTYESLLMLGHNEADKFGNFKAVVREFERDLILYLKVQFKDIREMAVIAAGNKVLGREEDVLGLIQGQLDTELLWVLINHVYENKISCRYLFPFFLRKNQLAFKAFSELTNKIGDLSTIILTQSDEALDILLESLSSAALHLMSVQILCNILGEGQGYWKLFVKTNLLDQCCILLQTEKDLKEPILKLLCNFAFEEGGATTLLRHVNLFSLLWEKLNVETSERQCSEFLNIFSFLAYKANDVQAFQKLVNSQLLDICDSKMIFNHDEVKLSSLQLVCGLVELGQKFPTEKDQNLAGLLLTQKRELLSKIEEYSSKENELIRGLSFFILDKLVPIEEEMPI